MGRPDSEHRAFEAIDDSAAGPSPRRPYAMSPNDALVQIALPLVLILAIIMRLMVVGQSISNWTRGPVILEMWKQQLILRLDQVMDDWATSAQLSAFPDPDRILWGDSLPADTRFQTLCQAALALDQPSELATTLYHSALVYEPEEAGETNRPAIRLFDPLAPHPPDEAERIPEAFVITPERRTYALDYAREQIARWTEHVEALQWSVVAESAARLPLEKSSPAGTAAAQMTEVASTLNASGYPLMKSLREEYGREESP